MEHLFVTVAEFLRNSGQLEKGRKLFSAENIGEYVGSFVYMYGSMVGIKRPHGISWINSEYIHVQVEVNPIEITKNLYYKKEQIDFQPLATWIQEQLGVAIPMVITYEEGMRTPMIETPNLQPHSGIFASVVKDVEVQFFNFNYNEIENTMWGTIYLNYNAWSRGSNGMKIGSFWRNPETGWTFETEKENYEKISNYNFKFI